MCEIVENYAREVAEQAAKEAAKEAREKNKVVARKLLERGVDFDVVLHSIESITGEELNEIYKDVKNNNI